MNDQRRSEAHIGSNARAKFAQRRRNYLGGHEHQRDVDSLAAVNRGKYPGPESKEEVNKLHSVVVTLN
jgi:hypothetical protein